MKLQPPLRGFHFKSNAKGVITRGYDRLGVLFFFLEHFQVWRLQLLHLQLKATVKSNCELLPVALLPCCPLALLFLFK